MDTLGRARELVKRRLEAGKNPELERERNRPETPTGEMEQEASEEERPYWGIIVWLCELYIVPSYVFDIQLLPIV